MESVRLFVGNIPPEVYENDITNEFSAYGKVTNVEIKSKENVLNPKESNIFAFVTININKDALESCLSEFKTERYRGRFLKVTVARESFLDRLKREREEISKSKDKSQNYLDNVEKNAIEYKAKENIKKKNNLKDYENHLNKTLNNLESTELITKRNTIPSFQNGRVNSFDKKSCNKIVFNDNNTSKEHTKNKIKLFDENVSNDEEYSFELEEKFKGKANKELMKLQSSSNNDSRFQLDERFLENEEFDEIADTKESNSPNEREWNLGIIENVAGQRFENFSKEKKKKSNNSMLRFDPTNTEHQAFLNNYKNKEIVCENKLSTNKKEEAHEETHENSIEVTTENYFYVNQEFSKSFQAGPTNFTLLNKFNQAQYQKSQNNSVLMESMQKKNTKTKKNLHQDDNPFKYDSSSDSDAEKLINIENNKTKTNNSKKVKTNKFGVRQENFFLFDKDERFKDGITFFQQSEDIKTFEKYEEIKKNLGAIIKKKISKRKKNLKIRSIRKVTTNKVNNL